MSLTELGPYRIVSLLGEGGMGRAYRAIHLPLDREVALKVLHARALETGDARARFQREMRIGATLSHPGLVKIYDGGEIDGADYLAMELVEGETLAARAARGPVDPAEARRLLAAAAEALAAVHALGFVHRDVKPANFMVDREGRLLLLDFGVVRVFEGVTLTATGEYLGTPLFMAPELIQGVPASAASDVYALGIAFWQLLAGRLPFEIDGLVRMLSRIATEGAPPLGPAAPSVPPDLVALIDSMIAREPSGRPTAAEVAKQASGAPARRPASSRSSRSGAIPRASAAIARPAPAGSTARARVGLALAIFVAGLAALGVARRAPPAPRGEPASPVASAAAPARAPALHALHGMCADTALLVTGVLDPPAPLAIEVREPGAVTLSWRQDEPRARFRAVIRDLKPDTSYRVRVGAFAEFPVRTASAAALKMVRRQLDGDTNLQFLGTMVSDARPFVGLANAAQAALDRGDFTLADPLARQLDRAVGPTERLLDVAAALARASASTRLLEATLRHAPARPTPRFRALVAQAAARSEHPRALELARAAVASPVTTSAELLDETLADLIRALPPTPEGVAEAIRAVESAAGPHGAWRDALLALPPASLAAALAAWDGATDPRLASLALGLRARRDAPGDRDLLVERATHGAHVLSATAACLLGDRADADAVARLDALTAVRHAAFPALLALTRVAPAPAPDALATHLSRLAREAPGEPARRAALGALGELSAHAERPTLTAALAERSGDVRRSAYLALARLGSRAGVPDVDRELTKAGLASYACALLAATAGPADAPAIQNLAAEIMLMADNPVSPRPARAAVYAWTLARHAPARWKEVASQLGDGPADRFVRAAARAALEPGGQMLLPATFVHRTGLKLARGDAVVVRATGALGEDDGLSLAPLTGPLPEPFRPVALLGDQVRELGAAPVQLVAAEDGELAVSLLGWPVLATAPDLARAQTGVIFVTVSRAQALPVW